ncbi:hypothetical protein T08_8289, partial [Trichinella sp. T8]
MNSALFLMSLLYYFYSTVHLDFFKHIVICRYLEEFKYKQLKFNFGKFGAVIFEVFLLLVLVETCAYILAKSARLNFRGYHLCIITEVFMVKIQNTPALCVGQYTTGKHL